MRPKTKEERNAELRESARHIVAGVENYSGADRLKRSAEVKAAFPPMKAAAKTAAKSAAKSMKTAEKTAKAATKTAAKATKKGPAPAGMSTGPHDGDLC